jgi:hypothetical protein
MKQQSLFNVLTVLALGATMAVAQQNQGKQPPPPMSFFVTSAGGGNGANLGGLAGADQHCQTLAAAAGAGNFTWHAYLSTQAKDGQPAVNARDRIGEGPWFNAKGQRVAKNLSDLHGDTLEEARVGNTLTKATAITEKGESVKGFGDQPNQHDILTGSQPDGRAYTDGMDHTCNNWTSSGEGSAQVGHFDRTGGPNTSWNSAHPSRGCSQQNLVSTGGAGLLYCFEHVIDGRIARHRHSERRVRQREGAFNSGSIEYRIRCRFNVNDELLRRLVHLISPEVAHHPRVHFLVLVECDIARILRRLAPRWRDQHPHAARLVVRDPARRVGIRYSFFAIGRPPYHLRQPVQAHDSFARRAPALSARHRSRTRRRYQSKCLSAIDHGILIPCATACRPSPPKR